MDPTGDFIIGILALLIGSSINLYGKQFITAVIKAMLGTITRLTATSLGKLGVTTVASTLISMRFF